jgi:adenylate cyclase class 2
MRAVEVEVKFAVSEPSALAGQLLSIGFRLLTPSTFERNTLFDTPEHTLRAARTILRIRRYGDRWVLTHKCLTADHDPSERHKHRVETETEVADGEALAVIFHGLGFHESFIYEKWRTEYSDATGHCVLDRTPIGTFAELEGPEAWIDEVAARLGLAPEALLTLSYGRLFERWCARTGSTAQNLTFAECSGSITFAPGSDR